MSDDLKIIVDKDEVLLVSGSAVQRKDISVNTGLHTLTAVVAKVNEGETHKTIKLLSKLDGSVIFTGKVDYVSASLGDSVLTKPFSCTKDPTGPDPDDPDDCKDECETIRVLLDKFKDCCCCLDDTNYWTKEEMFNTFITSLKDNTTGTPLDPSNPDHVSGATAWWKSQGINIEYTSDFFYGMAAILKYTEIMRYSGASQYLVLTLGTWNIDEKTYVQSIPKFYRCQYEFLKEIYRGDVVPEMVDWRTFNAKCEELSCLTSRKNRVELYLTYKWRSYVNFLQESPFSFVLNDDSIVQDLGDIVSYKSHVCQRFTFQEGDPNSSIMGWAVTLSGANVRFINTEPDSKNFNVGSHSPMMFNGGQVRATGFDYDASGATTQVRRADWSAELAPGGEADPSLSSDVKLAPLLKHNVLYTTIHESGHSIDYYKGKQIGKMFGFSLSDEWLDIAGWTLVGSNYHLDAANLGYPTKSPVKEPPVTIYGHTMPAEDFAEAWTGFIFNPKALELYYPKRYAFMNDNVVPFLNSLTYTKLDANPEVA